jgi:hypothetical protein
VVIFSGGPKTSKQIALLPGFWFVLSPTTLEIIDQIHELILEDRRISAKSIAEQLGISCERVGSIIQEDLDMLVACFLPGRAKDLSASLYEYCKYSPCESPAVKTASVYASQLRLLTTEDRVHTLTDVSGQVGPQTDLWLLLCRTRIERSLKDIRNWPYVKG